MIQLRSLARVLSIACVAGLVATPALAQQQSYPTGSTANYGRTASGPSYSGAGGASSGEMSFPKPSTAPSFQPDYSANPPAGGVALVNITYLFENCQHFQSEMEQLKNDLQSVDAQFKSRLENLQKRAQELSQFRPGTSQYEQLEKEIASNRTDFDLERNRARREFFVREGKIYYNTFTRIQAAIQQYAMERRLMAVIRFDQDSVDPENPKEVLRDVNRQVIWYNSTVDITGIILQRINAPRAANSNALPGLPGRH